MSVYEQSGGRVAGKVALVTGAASGIGRATSILLAEQGAAVTCADIDSTGAAQTADAILAHGGRAASTELDVTVEESWASCIDEIVRRHGRLDILVNSAGISFACPVAEMTLADWRRVLAVNLDGIFLGAKHAIRAMREQGGSIINVASASGIKAPP